MIHHGCQVRENPLSYVNAHAQNNPNHPQSLKTLNDREEAFLLY